MAHFFHNHLSIDKELERHDKVKKELELKLDSYAPGSSEYETYTLFLCALADSRVDVVDKIGR